MSTDSYLASHLMPEPDVTAGLMDSSARRHAESLSAALQALQGSGCFPDRRDTLIYVLDRLSAPWDALQVEWLTGPCIRGWMADLSSGNSSWEAIDQALAKLPNVAADPRFDRPFRLLFRVYNHLVPMARLGVRTVAAANDEVELWNSKAGNLQGEGISMSDVPTLPGTSAAIRNDIPQLRVRLRTDRVPERSGTIIGDSAPAGDEFYAADCLSSLQTAAAWLCRVWPEEFCDWRRTLRVIVPFRPPVGWTSEGFTISSMQGACWIAQADPLTCFESLLHEQSHIKLRYIEEECPFLAGDEDDRRFAVGWRTDPRPIRGILEGTYVHVHIMHGLLRLAGNSDFPVAVRSRAMNRFEKLLEDVPAGVQLLASHASLTPAGTAYIEWARAQVHALATSGRRLIAA